MIPHGVVADVVAAKAWIPQLYRATSAAVSIDDVCKLDLQKPRLTGITSGNLEVDGIDNVLRRDGADYLLHPEPSK